VEILTSAALRGFAHGFTTRRGGASRAPFDALNLGGNVGDEPAAVEENWARLAAATGLSFARVRQVHGDRVVPAAACDAREEADAVASATPGLAACVLVADCVPVLLADPRSGAVAAVHAGWRGTIARIAARAVEALARSHGARAGDLVAAIGPSIGPCCYEVAPELAERFARELGPEAAPAARRVDLWRANARVLEDAGVAPAAVDLLRRCTACEGELFFSHRRHAGRTGRQVGYVAPRPTPLP
jgi:YfiH family protein